MTFERLSEGNVFVGRGCISIGAIEDQSFQTQLEECIDDLRILEARRFLASEFGNRRVVDSYHNNFARNILGTQFGSDCAKGVFGRHRQLDQSHDHAYDNSDYGDLAPLPRHSRSAPCLSGSAPPRQQPAHPAFHARCRLFHRSNPKRTMLVIEL
jgi:hypothetical protein